MRSCASQSNAKSLESDFHKQQMESVAKPFKQCHLENDWHLRQRDKMDTKLEKPAVTKFGSCSDSLKCLPGVVVWMISLIQYFLFGLTPLFTYRLGIAPINIHFIWESLCTYKETKCSVHSLAHVFFLCVKAKNRNKNSGSFRASRVGVNHSTDMINRSPVAMFTIPA